MIARKVEDITDIDKNIRTLENKLTNIKLKIFANLLKQSFWFEDVWDKDIIIDKINIVLERVLEGNDE